MFKKMQFKSLFHEKASPKTKKEKVKEKGKALVDILENNKDRV